MSSGVSVNPACQTAFQQMSTGKPKLSYIIFMIKDKEVVVDAAVPTSELCVVSDDYENNSKDAYNAFVEDLRQRTNNFTDCRYAVFDFKFSCNRPGAGTSKMNKIVFIQLCPDSASIKNKMVYASSASAIKSSLATGQLIQFQVSDGDEIEHEVLLSRLLEKYRDN